jgi:hypothetical protein
MQTAAAHLVRSIKHKRAERRADVFMSRKTRVAAHARADVGPCGRIDRETSPRSRGSIYIIVLITIALVAAVGVTGLQLERVRSRTAAISTDINEARLLAQSASELGIGLINGSTGWRQAAIDGTGKLTAGSIGRGGYILSLSDRVDGDLADDPMDEVVLHTIVRMPKATHASEVTLQPTFDPLPALGMSLVTGGAFHVGGSHIITLTRGLCANGNMTTSVGTAQIIGEARATGTITGGLYSGPVFGSQAPITLPDASVVNDWAGRGTVIAYSAIPQNQISRQLLTPTINPYSASRDPRGVYVINAAGGNLTIARSRLVATLIVLNAGTVTIDSSTNWEPAEPGLPMLLVQGSIVLSLSANVLIEGAGNSGAQRNLNPAGAPYLGVTDSDTSDTYPSELNGLIFATGSLGVTNSNTVNGVIIVRGGTSFTGSLTVNANSNVLEHIPIGFGTTPVWVMKPRSARQVAP